MSDPFGELNELVHKQFSKTFTVVRTGETITVDIDETAAQDDYSGVRANSVDYVGEILPKDYSKVRAGDLLERDSEAYKVTEVMPPLEGTKDLFLKKVN